jgi:hypothetical protein
VVPNDFAAPTPKVEVVAPSKNAAVLVPVVVKDVVPVDEAAENSDDVAPAQPFSPEERQFVRAIVGASERPLSFQQIHDLLRNTRNRGADGVSRTNEELRSLIKLSINSGELQRIGRGNRVSYRLAVVAPVSEIEAESVAPATAVTTATPVVTMIPTPADLLDDGLTLPAAPSKAPRRTKRQDTTPEIVAPPPVPATEVKKPNQRRTPKATPATPAKTAELTPPVAPTATPEPTRATPRRRKKTTE